MCVSCVCVSVSLSLSLCVCVPDLCQSVSDLCQTRRTSLVKSSDKITRKVFPEMIVPDHDVVAAQARPNRSRTGLSPFLLGINRPSRKRHAASGSPTVVALRSAGSARMPCNVSCRRHQRSGPVRSAILLRRLKGLMSVHVSSMYCRHSALAPRVPTARHPSGILLSSGQMEYCSSSFITTT